MNTHTRTHKVKNERKQESSKVFRKIILRENEKVVRPPKHYPTDLSKVNYVKDSE